VIAAAPDQAFRGALSLKRTRRENLRLKVPQQAACRWVCIIDDALMTLLNKAFTMLALILPRPTIPSCMIKVFARFCVGLPVGNKIQRALFSDLDRAMRSASRKASPAGAGEISQGEGHRTATRSSDPPAGEAGWALERGSVRRRAPAFFVDRNDSHEPGPSRVPNRNNHPFCSETDVAGPLNNLASRRSYQIAVAGSPR
jgi:hypothetical protein